MISKNQLKIQYIGLHYTFKHFQDKCLSLFIQSFAKVVSFFQNIYQIHEFLISILNLDFLIVPEILGISVFIIIHIKKSIFKYYEFQNL